MSCLPYRFFILCLRFIINFPSIPYFASFVLSLPFIIPVPSYSLSWTLYSYPPFSTYLSFIINLSFYSLSYIIIILCVSYLASFIFIFRFLSINFPFYSLSCIIHFSSLFLISRPLYLSFIIYLFWQPFIIGYPSLPFKLHSQFSFTVTSIHLPFQSTYSEVAVLTFPYALIFFP